MMEFTLHLSEGFGNPTNTEYPITMKITSLTSLLSAVRFDHMAARCRYDYRSKANWQETDCILGDSDNDDTDDPTQWVTPEIVKGYMPDVAFFYVQSRNCYKVKHAGEPGEKSARPRFHYYFPLKAPVRDPDIADKLPRQLRGLISAFDGNALDRVRFFYGYRDPAPMGGYVEGKYDIKEFFESNPLPTCDEERSKESSQQEYQYNAQVNDTFIEKNLASMLQAIPADDEATWSFMCNCLKSLDKGLYGVFDSWSATSAKYNQKDNRGRTCAEMTAAKWEKSQPVMCAERAKATIIKMAKGCGWKADSDSLTGDYKARHDAAERRKAAINDAQKKVIDDLQQFGIDLNGMNVSDLTIIRRINGSIKRVIHVVTGEVWEEGGNV